MLSISTSVLYPSFFVIHVAVVVVVVAAAVVVVVVVVEHQDLVQARPWFSSTTIASPYLFVVCWLNWPNLGKLSIS